MVRSSYYADFTISNLNVFGHPGQPGVMCGAQFALCMKAATQTVDQVLALEDCLQVMVSDSKSHSITQYTGDTAQDCTKHLVHKNPERHWQVKVAMQES